MELAKSDAKIFRPSAEEILEKGLSVMSKACDAATDRDWETHA